MAPTAYADAWGRISSTAAAATIASGRGQREVREVQLLDHPDGRGSQRRLLVAGTRDDVGPAHAGEIERVDRERVADPRDPNWK
jgi:hypothetical protein